MLSLFKVIPFIFFKTVGVPSVNDLCRTLGIPEGPRSNRGHTARKKICPTKKKSFVGGNPWLLLIVPGVLTNMIYAS